MTRSADPSGDALVGVARGERGELLVGRLLLRNTTSRHGLVRQGLNLKELEMGRYLLL